MRCALVFVTGFAAFSAASAAVAAEQYAFPSVSGAAIAAAAPGAFVAPANKPEATGAITFAISAPGFAKAAQFTPPAFLPQPGTQREADAGGYRFVTRALDYAAIAHYASDYTRLFAPGHAVSAWTERVSGHVGRDYGSAVDSWTLAAYFFPALGGPRRDSAPDLSTMPALRAHPELQQPPVFKSN